MRLIVVLILTSGYVVSGQQAVVSGPVSIFSLPSAVVQHVQLFNSQGGGLSSTTGLFSMPTNCTHKGNIYQKGENWTSGHLRYTCGKFGIYDIIGCVTDTGRSLRIGEKYVLDNLAHQCFRKNSSVIYRQSICGIYGQPDCDKLTEDVPDLENFTGPIGHATATIITNEPPAVSGLPPGWTIASANETPGQSTVRLLIDVLPEPNSSVSSSQGIKAERSGDDRTIRQPGVGVGTLTPVSVSPEELGKERERVVGVGTGSVSLSARTPQSSVSNMLPGTVGGTRSDVNWSGKTMMINGKTIALGPGTFVFGTSPTGAYVQKIN